MPKKKSTKPAKNPEEREKQLINKAMVLAEKQLDDGTAAPSTLNHFLKLATAKEEKERELLASQAEVAKAKADSIKSQKEAKELYSDVVTAMKDYSPTKNKNVL